MSFEKNTDLTADTPPAGRPSPLGYVIDGLNGVGSILIFCVMLLMCSDVLARDLFNKPIAGVAELVALSIVCIVFLQLASTLRHDRMSRADIFIDPFMRRRPKPGNLLMAIFNGFGCFIMIVIFNATLPVFLKAWEDSEFVGVEGLFTAPIWPVRLVVLVGSALTALQYGLLSLGNLGVALGLRQPKTEG